MAQPAKKKRKKFGFFEYIRVPHTIWDEFLAYQYERNHLQIKYLCIMTVIGYLLFSIPIFIYLPHLQPLDLIIRVVILCVFGLLAYVYSFRRKDLEVMDFLIFLFTTVACISWISLLYGLKDPDVYRLTIAAASICILSAFISTKYIYALLSNIVVIGFGLALLFSLDVDESYIFFDLFCIVLPGVIFALYISLQNLQRSKYDFLIYIRAEKENSALNTHNKNLRSQAFTDQLTNIKNRRLFDAEAKMLFEEAQTDPENRFALFILDLDYFKYYNDNYGHVKGDQCLITVSGILNEICHYYNASLYRYGGEEFVVSYEYNNKYEVIDLARNLMMIINDEHIPHHYRPDSKDYVTVSVGVSNSEDKDFESLTEMLEIADKKLYQAKEEGRDTYVI